MKPDDMSWMEYAKDLEVRLKAAKSILWIAEQYAEAGGSRGPEMRDYEAAMEIIES